MTWLCLLFERRWSCFRIPLQTATVGLALVAVGAVRAADEFDGPRPGVWLYVCGSTWGRWEGPWPG